MTISYGNDLANTHLIQKYGFVTRDNPVKKLTMNMPFHEYEALTYEEAPLKKELSQTHRIPYSQSGIMNSIFYNSKFPQEVLAQIRLAFFTSRMLMDNGGVGFLEGKDFSEAIEM